MLSYLMIQCSVEVHVTFSAINRSTKMTTENVLPIFFWCFISLPSTLALQTSRDISSLLLWFAVLPVRTKHMRRKELHQMVYHDGLTGQTVRNMRAGSADNIALTVFSSNTFVHQFLIV